MVQKGVTAQFLHLTGGEGARSWKVSKRKTDFKKLISWRLMWNTESAIREMSIGLFPGAWHRGRPGAFI